MIFELNSTLLIGLFPKKKPSKEYSLEGLTLLQKAYRWMLMLFDVLMSPSFDEMIKEYMPDVKSFTEKERVLSDIGST